MFTLSRRCLQRDSTSAVLPLPSHDTTRAKQVGAASGGIREALAQCRRAPADRSADADGEGTLVPVALGFVERRVALVKRARIVHFLVRVAVPVAACRRAPRRRRHYISRPAEIALNFAAPTAGSGAVPVVRVAFAPVVRVAPPAPVLSVRHPSRLRSPAVAVLTAAHRLCTNTRGNYGTLFPFKFKGASQGRPTWPLSPP